MPTQKQSAASRANGAQSRGPVTPMGKQTSARNSLRHGILAQTVVLNGESHQRFADLLRALVAEYRPVTESETALVETMAVARWRLMRIWSVEKVSLDLELTRHQGAGPVRCAKALATIADRVGALHRYESAYDRQFSRALRQLTTLQQRPRPTEDDDALEITHASGTWESGPFPIQPGVTPGPTPLPDSPAPTGSGASRPAASTTPQPSISPNEPGDLVQTKAPAFRTIHTINSPRSPHPAVRRRRKSLRPAFRAVFSRRHSA